MYSLCHRQFYFSVNVAKKKMWKMMEKIEMEREAEENQFMEAARKRRERERVKARRHALLFGNCSLT